MYFIRTFAFGWNRNMRKIMLAMVTGIVFFIVIYLLNVSFSHERKMSKFSYITKTKASLTTQNLTLDLLKEKKNKKDENTTAISANTQKIQKIIYYLHLHKAGGSTMCNWAHQNGKLTPPNNCAINTTMPCCGGETIKEQQMFALQTKYTFIANENYMFAQMDMKYYDYVITMRNSFRRYVSHYQHIARVQYMKRDFQTWLKGQPDNWITRHICGTPCKNRPKYALTLQDVMMVYHRMRNFSDILFLETWNHDAVTFASKRKWKSGVNIHDLAAHYNQSLYSSLMTTLDDIIYEQAFSKYWQKEEAVEQKVLNELHKIRKMNFNFTSPCGKICTEY